VVVSINEKVELQQLFLSPLQIRAITPGA